jgi:hypothetical protein
MGYAALHRELIRMLKQAQRQVAWFNLDERAKLLPALQAMHNLVAQPGRRIADPDKPNWDDECRLLGISPDLVRKWKQRTAADTDIRVLLGEKPKPGQKPSASEATRHLKALVEAVLGGQDDRAEDLAMVYEEIYQFHKF